MGALFIEGRPPLPPLSKHQFVTLSQAQLLHTYTKQVGEKHMDSFDLKMPQEYAIKSEVSDTILPECEQFEDERHAGNSSSEISQVTSDELPMKRSSSDEQVSSEDSNSVDPSLPPRKRAKTQEEKEQRRLERIMRNRQAAHASREKKRKHLESLELRCSQLEAANNALKGAGSSENMYKLRVQQLETAIVMAQRSGEWASLNDVMNQPPMPDYFENVNGSQPSSASASQLEVPTDTAQATPRHGGSPAPSLVDDCASPDALVIKSEETDSYLPLSPEKCAMDPELDIYSMTNFGFDSNPPASADTLTFSESSSKSRHPADLTPLPVELFLA